MNISVKERVEDLLLKITWWLNYSYTRCMGYLTMHVICTNNIKWLVSFYVYCAIKNGVSLFFTLCYALHIHTVVHICN